MSRFGEKTRWFQERVVRSPSLEWAMIKNFGPRHTCEYPFSPTVRRGAEQTEKRHNTRGLRRDFLRVLFVWFRLIIGLSTGRTFFMRRFPLPWCDAVILTRIAPSFGARMGDNEHEDESTGTRYENGRTTRGNTCRSADSWTINSQINRSIGK